MSAVENATAPWERKEPNDGITRGYSTPEISMGSCSYWPLGPSRSKAYRRFDDALDTFEERAESFVVNITHGLRVIARKLDDNFGGDE